MLEFMVDPKSHSEFDEEVLDINILNDRGRSALMLCFTPPIATQSSILNGIDIIKVKDDDGDEAANDYVVMPTLVRPEGIETMAEWIKPGGVSER